VESNKELVAYGQLQEGQRLVYVHNYETGTRQQFRIRLTTAPIPAGREMEQEKVHVMVGMTCEGNLYHFFEELFRYVYHAVAALGALSSTDCIRVHYTAPDHGVSTDGCRSQARDSVLYTLVGAQLQRSPQSWTDTPQCFGRAIFGEHRSWAAENGIAHMVERATQLTDDAEVAGRCPQDAIVLMKRKSRRILNIEQLVKKIETELNVPVAVLTFDQHLPVLQQLLCIHRARALVGVHGAGLEWCRFLRKQSALIEFVWEGWGSYYLAKAQAHGLAAADIFVQDTEPNFEVLEKKTRCKFSAKERKTQLLDQAKCPALLGHSIPKYSDVRPNVTEVIQTLKTLLKI
jgi:hypothetical protein